jgi:hypothetical protein
MIQFGILRTVKSKKTERTVTSKIEKSRGLSNLQRRYFIQFDRNPGNSLLLTNCFCLGGKNRPFLAPESDYANAYDPAQLNGLVRQVVTEPQELVSAVPTFACLTATQKTNATRRTIKVYSTKPCPSSSTTNLFRNSIILSPPFFTTIDQQVLSPDRRLTNYERPSFEDLSSCWLAERADIMPVISDHIFQRLTGIRPIFCKLSLTKVTGSLNEVSQSAQPRSHKHAEFQPRKKRCVNRPPLRCRKCATWIGT